MQKHSKKTLTIADQIDHVHKDLARPDLLDEVRRLLEKKLICLSKGGPS